MQKLTKEIHGHLYANGYRYLALKDVQPIDGTKSFKHIVQPIKEIPAVVVHACTGMHDEMILSILSGRTDHIELYLENPSRSIPNNQ